MNKPTNLVLGRSKLEVRIPMATTAENVDEYLYADMEGAGMKFECPSPRIVPNAKQSWDTLYNVSIEQAINEGAKVEYGFICYLSLESTAPENHKRSSWGYYVITPTKVSDLYLMTSKSKKHRRLADIHIHGDVVETAPCLQLLFITELQADVFGEPQEDGVIRFYPYMFGNRSELVREVVELRPARRITYEGDTFVVID